MEKKQFHEKSAFRFRRFARKSYSAFASIGKTVSIGVVAGCTLSMMSGAVVAQDGQKPAKVIEKELTEVMVTASLTESPLEEVTQTITVLTKQDIQRAPVQSINDLLTYVASVDVIQRGGHGVQTDLSIRGGSLDQVAILINGINLSNAQTGHFALDISINLSDIERIEILHGPSALVYGSSAFSGGINIITKKNLIEKVYFNITSGMYEFRSLEARGVAKLGNTINSLSAGYKASDGYISNSDYNIYNMLWQTRLNIESNNKIDIQLGYYDKKFGANTFYTAAYPNQYEEVSSYMGTVKGSFGTKLKFTPTIYWIRHHDRFDLIRETSLGQNFHRGDTYGTNLILSYKSKLGTTSIATELRKDEIMSTKLGLPMVESHRKYSKYDARTNVSEGLEHTLNLDRFVLTGGILINHNSLESDKYYFFPSVSAAYFPTPHFKINTSWSKSTRMPTFTDLYYTTETHNANETLKAERSESWEIGVKYKNDFMSTYATAYLSWGRNIIDWVKTNPNDEKWSSWNHSKTGNKGIEIGTKINLTYLLPQFGSNTYLKIDYSQMTQKADSKEMISLYSLNYLKSKVITQLNHNLYKKLSATWFFRFQNRAGSYVKYENSAPVRKEKYPSFTTLDIRLNYHIDDFNINLNLKNLYNTAYFDLGNIPQAGFWLMGGISYTLK